MNSLKSIIKDQSGIAPLVLVLFAGFWILFSIGFLDRWYFKINKTFIAQNPVVTSDYLASAQDEIDTICLDDEDVDCGINGEGDDINSSALANAE